MRGVFQPGEFGHVLAGAGIKLAAPADPSEDAIIALLDGAQKAYTTWDGWYKLDAYERGLGEPEGRDRVKVVEREDMLRASRE